MNKRNFASALALGSVLAVTRTADADSAALPGTHSLASKHSFSTLVGRVEAAVAQQKMGLVASASASAGAAARGIKIPGNAVLMVFRNDYAVRMLQASVAAGIEAPIRLYVTENADGTASLTYRSPSAVFARYQSVPLQVMAAERSCAMQRLANSGRTNPILVPAGLSVVHTP